MFSAVLTHASRHTNVAPRALTRTRVAGLLYSPVRPLVDVKVFRVLLRAINTSKAGPNVSLTPIDPYETSRLITDDLDWSKGFLFQSWLVTWGIIDNSDTRHDHYIIELRSVHDEAYLPSTG